MATPEGVVKRNIKKLLNAAQVYWVMPVSNGMGVHGVPDFLICHQGRFIAIEAKAGKGVTTALQEKHLADIRAAGGVAVVINETNLHILQEILNGQS